MDNKCEGGTTTVVLLYELFLYLYYKGLSLGTTSWRALFFK